MREMRVTLTRFRCYVEPRTFDFAPDNFTLLIGESGAGKSTIFEAIVWCLYGGIHQTSPLGITIDARHQTSVVIELPELQGLIISRSRTPEVLKVSLPGHGTFTNAEGQAYLDSVFGKKNLFYANSYIAQGDRSILISCPNSEKIDLLHELTFGIQVLETEDPDVYLGRIDTERDMCKGQIQQLTAEFNVLNDAYSVAVDANGAACSMWVENSNGQTLQTITNRITELKGQISKRADLLTHLRTLLTQRETIAQQLPHLEIDTRDADRTKIVELNESFTVLKNYERYQTLITQKREIEQQLPEKVDLEAPLTNISKLRTQEFHLSQIDEYFTQLERNGPDHRDEWTLKIAELREHLTHIKRYSEYRALADRATKLRSELPDLAQNPHPEYNRLQHEHAEGIKQIEAIRQQERQQDSVIQSLQTQIASCSKDEMVLKPVLAALERRLTELFGSHTENDLHLANQKEALEAKLSHLEALKQEYSSLGIRTYSLASKEVRTLDVAWSLAEWNRCEAALNEAKKAESQYQTAIEKWNQTCARLQNDYTTQREKRLAIQLRNSELKARYGEYLRNYDIYSTAAKVYSELVKHKEDLESEQATLTEQLQNLHIPTLVAAFGGSQAPSISELETLRNQLTQSRNILRCPHCHTSVIVKNQELIENNLPQYSEAEYQSRLSSISQLLEELQTQDRINWRLSLLATELHEIKLPPKPSPPEKVDPQYEPVPEISPLELPQKPVLQVIDIPPKPSKSKEDLTHLMSRLKELPFEPDESQSLREQLTFIDKIPLIRECLARFDELEKRSKDASNSKMKFEEELQRATKQSNEIRKKLTEQQTKNKTIEQNLRHYEELVQRFDLDTEKHHLISHQLDDLRIELDQFPKEVQNLQINNPKDAIDRDEADIVKYQEKIRSYGEILRETERLRLSLQLTDETKEATISNLKTIRQKLSEEEQRLSQLVKQDQLRTRLTTQLVPVNAQISMLGEMNEMYWNLLTEATTINERKKYLERRIADYTERETLHRHISEELQRLTLEISNISSESLDALTTKQTTETQELEMLMELTKAGEIYERLTTQETTLKAKRTSLMEYLEYEAKLGKLRTIVQDLANQAMDETVTAINDTTNLILKDMFDEDIRVSLRLYRELKTSNRIKQQVNLQIIYRDQIYESPSRFSGGEQDRISMALTLALAKVSGSPILLLDECMASLDNAMRERCLIALRKHLDNKTVIDVCHEAVVGIHDHSVRITED